MKIPNLITNRTARLPGDFATHEQIAEAAQRLQQQATLTTGPEDAIAPADAPAGQDGAGMGIVAFAVECIPVAQPRQRHRVIVPKVGKPFASNYTPKSDPVTQFKHEIRQAFASKKPSCWDVTAAMDVRLTFAFPRPASKTKKHGDNPPYPKTGKPDCDNLAKACMDALNGLAWNDDSQVAVLFVQKWVAEPGAFVGVKVTIEAI